MPRFGKDKDARKEELDRQAAEEVERLTRRGGPPGVGGGGTGGFGGPGAPSVAMPSPLEMMAAEIADGPRPVRRGAQAPRKAARPQQAFTPMPSGEVGSSFGPGGLNPGPRGGFGAPPPPAFGGGGGMDDDYGGHVTGPTVYYNAPTEPDEDEEISITELALMDHAKRTGHRPEDLVMQYDAGTAEEMRDEAMRKFYERQQSRRPGGGTDNPFAPAGMRRGPATSSAGPVRRDDPAAAGGALAARLANKRRREDEEARRAQGAAQPSASAGPAPSSRPPTAPRRSQPAAASAPPAEANLDEGALARVLARRRAALGLDAPEPEPDTAPAAEGRRPDSQATDAPNRKAVPAEPDSDDVPSLDDMAAATPTRSTKKAPAKKAAAAKKAPVAKKAPAAKRTTKAPKAPEAALAAKAAKAPAKAKKGGATLAKAPAAKKAAATRPTGKAKTIFCIECGEKNPAIAKFCFNCGNRLAVPEG